MATTTDIRKWAKAQGLDVGAKGPISPELAEQYEAAHADPDAHYTVPDGTAPDVASAAPPPPADPGQAERTPARPPKAKVPGRGSGWLARLRRPAAGGTARKPARKLPRVSLANLIEDAWGQMAWASAPMPPMQRLLQAQAPFAGIALEDALAGTVADRALQPLARAEDKAKAVGGLMFPPMALMLVMATAPQPQVVVDPDSQQETYVWPEPSTQHKGALMSLRWSLMLWSEAGAARLEEYQARAEASADRGRQADAFMAWILGGPAPEEREDQAAETDSIRAAVSAEDDAVRRAQELFGRGE